VRVALDGDNAREVARYDMNRRIRAVAQSPDGTLWLLEDGSKGPLAEAGSSPLTTCARTTFGNMSAMCYRHR
jgi:hypothetical protein